MKFIKFGGIYVNFDLVESVAEHEGTIYACTATVKFKEIYDTSEAAQARLDELLGILNNGPHQDTPAQFYYPRFEDKYENPLAPPHKITCSE